MHVLQLYQPYQVVGNDEVYPILDNRLDCFGREVSPGAPLLESVLVKQVRHVNPVTLVVLSGVLTA